MEKHLDSNYLPELFRACINKKGVFLVVKQHMKASYLPEDTYRIVWKEMVRYFDKEDKPPTIGILNQLLRGQEQALDSVAEIKNIVKVDNEGLIKAFEDFIRQHRFVELYESLGDTYNEGKKEETYAKFYKGAQELANFTMHQALHDQIFKGFTKRFTDRMINQNHEDKHIPIGIDMLDNKMNGGPQRAETTLFLGDSGVGKSQLLILAGITAARRGFKVAHFQAEGTRQQAMDRYDAAWTGTLYRDMKISNIDDKKYKILQTRIKQIGGEIHIECKEQFGAWTMVGIRNSIVNMFRAYGKIDVVIIDYLDLIDPGDGQTYRASEERFRQQAVARMMKDIAVEFNVSLITVTQSSSIPPESRNDEDFVLTRWNLSEDKGKLRPFDNFITLNQTRDQKKQNIMRLFPDKLREHESGYDAIPIVQNLARARFYDKKKTIEMFAEELIDE